MLLFHCVISIQIKLKKNLHNFPHKQLYFRKANKARIHYIYYIIAAS